MFFAFDRITIAGDPPTPRTVLYVCPQETYVVVLDTSDAQAWPEICGMADAVDLVAAGTWTCAPGHPPPIPLEAGISEKHRRKRDESWGVIAAIMTDGIPDVFFRMPRARLISQAVQESGRSRPTVSKLLQRCLHGGMSKAALLPGWVNCGAPGVTRTPGEKKRGRPAAEGHPIGVNVTDDIRHVFMRAISLSYVRERRHDMVSAYHFCIRRFFTVEAPVDTGRRTDLAKLPGFESGLPTIGQFRYWFAIDNDRSAVERRRLSDRVYDMKRKPLLMTSTAEAVGPCSRFQIDATVLDLYARSRADRRILIGRPTLYVVIDVFSRMIVGIYVGLESPSWVAAMMALANAVEDKVAFCASNGIVIAPEEWPVNHLCGILEGDRGEIESAGIEGVLQRYRMNVETAAAYRADWKGIVESRFKTLPAIFKPYVPGYVETDFRERGADDYRAEAILDIDEITKIIVTLVLYYNNDHELEGYPAHRGQIEDRVPSVPLDLWRWGLANRSGTPRAPRPEEFRFALMPQAMGSVTPQGIVFEGRCYTCQKALREGWYTKARTKRFKVPFSYDKRSTDRIYVHDPEAEFGYDIGLLNQHSSAHQGLTAWESHGLATVQARTSAARRDDQVLARAAAEADVEGIVDDARTQMAALDPLDSLRLQVAGVRDARREELSGDRLVEVATFRPDEPDADDRGESGADVVPIRPGVVVGPASRPSMRDFRNKNRSEK